MTFSREEWGQLGPTQWTLYQEVMLQTCGLLASLCKGSPLTPVRNPWFLAVRIGGATCPPPEPLVSWFLFLLPVSLCVCRVSVGLRQCPSEHKASPQGPARCNLSLNPYSRCHRGQAGPAWSCHVSHSSGAGSWAMGRSETVSHAGSTWYLSPVSPEQQGQGKLPLCLVVITTGFLRPGPRSLPGQESEARRNVGATCGAPKS